MAYALCREGSNLAAMSNRPFALASDGETIAELRELYRAAEARAARLRLLSASGRELAEADTASLEAVIQRCAERLAWFTGSGSAFVMSADNAEGIAIRAPGPGGAVIAKLAIPGLDGLEAIPDPEDREAFRMQLEMMGSTIDRIERERERAELLRALQERERRLALLLEKVFTAQEEERRRVSHELHDGVAQTATALVRLLERAESAGLAAGPAPKEIARSLVAELRRVIAGLRPTLLDDLGLAAALQSLGDGLEQEGFEVRLALGDADARLGPLTETALFRVAQEAVSNIHKHAGGPCRVTIEARLGDDPVVLRIADQGRGPSSATRDHGAFSGHNVGIDVMRERMAALGGTVDWRGEAGHGVSVEARLPRGAPG
ncbi:two-component sensor histidine kinase [Erythrobacter litoralis]|nr:two-component sensor histidine kinase [Erythrobacter litoralis]